MRPITKIKLMLITLASTVCSGFAHSEAHLQPTYEFQDLGTLTSRTHSSATGINNLNQVVGESHNNLVLSTPLGGDAHATIWISGKAFDLGTLGGTYSSASAINDMGQVIGESDTVDGLERHAVRWDFGRKIDLARSLPSQAYSTGSGINRAGQSVGNAGTSVFGAQGVIWTGKRSRNLDLPLGASSAYAVGINNKGQVAGYGFFSGNNKVIVWNGSATTVLNLLPGGTVAIPNAINDIGAIVGYGNTSPGAVHAALWKDGKVIDLGSLEDPSGFSSAWSINCHGVVVGSSQLNDGSLHAVRWSEGAIADLNAYLPIEMKTAGWVLTEARAINNQGSIAGNMQNQKTGVTHAFLLQAKIRREVQSDLESH